MIKFKSAWHAVAFWGFIALAVGVTIYFATRG